MSSVKSKKKLNFVVDNDDLLTEILVRLPLKSLLRFKSVCKHWNSLISNPLFSRCLYPDVYLVSGLILHRRSYLQIPEHDFVSLRDEPTTPPFKTLPFVNRPLGLKILQSCHGLLLCSSFRDSTFRYDSYIYNPTTKQFRAIPRPGGQISTLIKGITLAYNPDKSSHYKVVCVREANLLENYHGVYWRYKYMHFSCERTVLGNYSRYQIEIYSSKTHSWRLSGKAFIAHDNLSFKSGVFWNGAVHWVNLSCPSLYFKVNEEKLRRMPTPDVWEEGSKFVYLDESREHLHLVVILPYTTKFDVYEMKEDYSEWLVKYHVDLGAVKISIPDMITICLDRRYKLVILGIIREEDDEESYMVLHIPGKAIRYKLSDGSFYKICDFSMGPKEILFDSYQYIETLASI